MTIVTERGDEKISSYAIIWAFEEFYFYLKVSAVILDGRYQGLEPYELEYLKVTRCPLCDAAGGQRVPLPIAAYWFGRRAIRLPPGGVHLV